MKKVSKISRFFMLVLSLLVSMTAVAFAASQHTTGLKDGVYSASTAQDSNGYVFKANVVVDSGKVTSYALTWIASGTELQEAYAAYAPTPAAQQAIKDGFAEIKYYNSQMSSVGDAVKVAKYSSAKSDMIYTAFQSTWKDVVNQAGGKIVDDSAPTTAASTSSAATTAATTSTAASTTTSTTTTATSNPKTGDNGVVGYVIVAVAALATIVIVSRKKVTA